MRVDSTSDSNDSAAWNHLVVAVCLVIMAIMSLPVALEKIVGAFKMAPKPLKLQLLLEFAGKVRDLPPELQQHKDRMEQVTECQTPFFLATEYLKDRRVILHFDAPQEAPTTRGFAGILTQGLNGQRADAILRIPNDFYLEMGLGQAISPLRLRGMSAILARIKRQVHEHQSADYPTET